jgi:hypothetical protein
MADITKCKGVNCPIKGSCYRYTANESEFRQSYFTNNNVGYETKDGFKCDMYWGNKQEQVFNQLKDITNGTD